MRSTVGRRGPGWWRIPVVGEKHALNISEGLQRALPVFQLLLGQTLRVKQLLGQLLLLLLRCQARSDGTAAWTSFSRSWKVEAGLRLADGGLVHWRIAVAGATAREVFGFHAGGG